MRTALAIFLVPFLWMAADWLLSPLRRYLHQALPEGRLKRVLLRRVLTL
jgi:hypothetical protein